MSSNVIRKRVNFRQDLVQQELSRLQERIKLIRSLTNNADHNDFLQNMLTHEQNLQRKLHELQCNQERQRKHRAKKMEAKKLKAETLRSLESPLPSSTSSSSSSISPIYSQSPMNQLQSTIRSLLNQNKSTRTSTSSTRVAFIQTYGPLLSNLQNHQPSKLKDKHVLNLGHDFDPCNSEG
jgi:hypothetical protein